MTKEERLFRESISKMAGPDEALVWDTRFNTVKNIPYNGAAGLFADNSASETDPTVASTSPHKLTF